MRYAGPLCSDSKVWMGITLCDTCFLSISELLIHPYPAYPTSAESFSPALRAEPPGKDPSPEGKAAYLYLGFPDGCLLVTSFWNTVKRFYLKRPRLKPDGGEGVAGSYLVKGKGPLVLEVNGWRVEGERGPRHHGVTS